MFWSVTPEWLGEVVFILACGPSYLRVPVERLKDRGRIIAINDAYERVPWADIVYIGDLPFLREHEHKLMTRFTGRYIVSLGHDLPGVRALKDTGQLGLETDPGGLKNGSNSGYAAINLAYHLGATKIALIGYDLSIPEDKQLHWQHRSRNQTVPGFQLTLDVMLKCFPYLVQPLYDAGVSVVNCTPHSALKCWPYVTLYEVLHNLKNEKFWEEKRLAVNSERKEVNQCSQTLQA